ncbi:hypothetical protein HDU91_000946 [Kappamyces sp. JEL0680]|nr:hypothetical protein HDU91_000946 [Kappamyces sp. JEL0680]
MAAGKNTTNFGSHFIAGGLAGTIGATILCPLEVVKTRLQEGVRALWKGLTPNLIGIVPARSIYFSVYSKGKELYTRMNHGVENSGVHMVSAATAGIATALCTNPIWLVKTRMQLQSEAAVKNSGLVTYRNSFHCLQTVLREEGVRGLYRGLSASLLGLTESTFQFVMYEYFKAAMLKTHKSRDSAATHLSRNASRLTVGWIETTTAASTAKLIAAVVTYPHEVIRTRLRQTPENGVRKYTGLWQSAKLIYQQEGVVALYGGMTAHLLRVVPNAAILFLSYEVIVRFLEKWEHGNKRP